MIVWSIFYFNKRNATSHKRKQLIAKKAAGRFVCVLQSGQSKIAKNQNKKMSLIYFHRISMSEQRPSFLLTLEWPIMQKQKKIIVSLKQSVSGLHHLDTSVYF